MYCITIVIVQVLHTPSYMYYIAIVSVQVLRLLWVPGSHAK